MGKENQTLIDAILEFDEDKVVSEVKKMKSEGVKPLEIMETCRIAMDKVGTMFQNKEIFLTELIMAGELLNTIMTDLGLKSDAMSASGGKSKGKILIGTVKDDIHDIGKNIIKGLLISNGYEIKDVGVDIPAQKFVDEINKFNPKVVALSGLLTVAYDSMKATVEALKKAGIRTNLKVIIGGGSIDQKVADYVGADTFGASAVDGVEKINKWF